MKVKRIFQRKEVVIVPCLQLTKQILGGARRNYGKETEDIGREGTEGLKVGPLKLLAQDGKDPFFPILQLKLQKIEVLGGWLVHNHTTDSWQSQV